MKSSCMAPMVFTKSLNSVQSGNFPRLRSNTHTPAWLSNPKSAVSPITHSFMWHFVGGYRNVRTVRVLRAYLIGFSRHLFYCIQISPPDQVTTLVSELLVKSFLTNLCPCLKPVPPQVRGVWLPGWSLTRKPEAQTICPVWGNVVEHSRCLVKKILKVPSTSCYWGL